MGCEKKVKDFTQIRVENSDGKEINLVQLTDTFSVFTFLSPECPLSENYTRTLLSMQDSLRRQGVSFYYLFPGKFYPRPQIEQFAKTYGLPSSSILYDPEYQFRNYCKANTTPEAFLINGLGEILYYGAIDNWAITLGKQRQITTEHYLSDAIEEALNGENITLKSVKAVGCIIE
jgi:hypothetical protein